MEILSSLGQIYMFILLVLLFIGSGLAVWALINNLASNNNPAKQGVQDKGKPPVVSKAPNNNTIIKKSEMDKKSGGFKITDSRWYKLAVFSLMGILLSVTLLGFASTNSNNASAHNHSNNQSAMNGVQMGNMPVNNMPVNTGVPNDYMLQQQLYMMQQQINKMQQMLNMQMQQSGGGMGGM